MSNRRTLDPVERALWERVMASVKPLHAARGHAAKGTPAKLAVKVAAKSAAKPAGATAAPHSGIAPTRENFAHMLAHPVKPKPAPAPKAAVTQHRVDHHAPFVSGPIDGGLDGHWDRRLNKGAVMPDVSVDLHGLGLAHAHARLDGVLEQSIRSGARVILLVTGKLRDHDRATGQGRGAIRAAVTDWLAASRHHAHIASVRAAHPRHGGDGALYIILKRR